jgi:hypothetical protein
MRTWRRVVIAAVVLATAFLLYRWWQQTSSRADRHARRAGDPPASPKLDRALADRMREQIRALLAEAGPMVAGAAPSATPTPAPSFGTMPLVPDLDGGTKVDPNYLRSVVRRDFLPLAKDCYGTALAKNPQLEGRIELHFQILGDRKVGGVVDGAEFTDRTTIDDPEMRTCMMESMLSVSFDAPPEDGTLSITYPFEFLTGEPEGGAGD